MAHTSGTPKDCCVRCAEAIMILNNQECYFFCCHWAFQQFSILADNKRGSACTTGMHHVPYDNSLVGERLYSSTEVSKLTRHTASTLCARVGGGGLHMHAGFCMRQLHSSYSTIFLTTRPQGTERALFPKGPFPIANKSFRVHLGGLRNSTQPLLMEL